MDNDFIGPLVSAVAGEWEPKRKLPELTDLEYTVLLNVLKRESYNPIVKRILDKVENGKDSR